MSLIALFTDYGFEGPYVGQVHAAIHALAPEARVIDLQHDAPRNNPRASAYLLAALAPGFPSGTVFFCVIDPGVGTGKDEPVVMDLDGRLFAGPDNGLFDIAVRRSRKMSCRRIRWRPERLSQAFHGRDLYAPVCAMLATAGNSDLEPVAWRDRHGWPDDLWEIIYIDRFGNCMTGIRVESIDTNAVLNRGGRRITHAVTFARAPSGEPFWYGNSIGLVEIAVNGGSAADMLRLKIGSTMRC
jgi:S-adenosylmethionine hydrolase